MADPNLTVPAPESLVLEDVINRLKQEDPAKVLPVGFSAPHSYRGYYDELAFEIRHDITVSEMLAAAESAVGATYTGWKGGEYEMSRYSPCWLVTERGDTGETVGAVFLALLLAAGKAVS